MFKRTLLLILALMVLVAPVRAADKAVPGMPLTLNYQGRLTWLAGNPVADGNYDITLRLYDADVGGTNLWEETQTVFVYDSVFSTVLGEITSLAPVDFNQHLWLSVEVPAIFSGEMSPRIPLTSTPYSFIAGDLVDGAAVRSLNGLSDDVSLVAGTGMTITPSGNTLVLTATGGGGGGSDADWGINGNDMYSLPTGNVGIGTMAPDKNLHVVGSGTGGAHIKVEDVTDSATRSSQLASVLVGTELGAGRLAMATTTSGTRNLELAALSSNTDISVQASDDIKLNYQSRLQIQNILYSVAEFNASRELVFYAGLETPVMIRAYDPNSAFGGGEIQLGDGQGTTTVLLDGHKSNNVGGTMELYGDTGNLTVALHGKRDSGTHTGLLQMFDEAGIQTVRIAGMNNSSDGDRGGIVSLSNHLGTQTVRMSAQENGNPSQGGVLKLYDESGNLTIELDGDYGSTNEGRITTNVLEITGGADFSEQFDITSTLADVTPGQVVCIDPDRPGELKLSDKAYDTCVAGVISGAGGVRPGMVMGQKGSVADGAHPVALTGRVYVKADARRRPIRPGDLLTTSDTPGYAMKVGDSGLAQGAVLGKAMTGLAGGQGLILVLVSLQ